MTDDDAIGNYEDGLIDNEDPSKGIILVHGNGDVFKSDISLKWEVKFIINCNKESMEKVDEKEKENGKKKHFGILFTYYKYLYFIRIVKT